MIAQILFGIFVYVLLRSGELLAVMLHRVGKVRIGWLDPDSGTLKLDFYNRKGNHVVVGKGPTAKKFILQGLARYTSKYPTWFLHPEHGWNYRASTNAESIDKEGKLALFSIANPSSYYKATARNEWASSLDANEEKDRWGWVMPVAICSAVFLVLLVAMVAYVIVKLNGGQSA